MKRYFLPALISMLIVFLWQMLSYMALPTHKYMGKYISTQDSVLNVLNKYLPEDGAYMIPHVNPDSPTAHEDMEKMEAQMKGKPMAMVFYNKSWDGSMGMMMFWGFVINFIMAFFLICTINMFETSINTFGKRYYMALIFALFYVFQGPLTSWNWYLLPPHFWWGEVFDAIVMWSLVGIFLGWWLGKFQKN